MKILLVGDYPPPYGGVSVQVSTLRRLLAARPGFVCRVLDIGESRHQRRPECLSVRTPLDFAWKLAAHAVRGYAIHLHTNGHNLKSWLVSLACAGAGVLNGRRTIVSIGSGLAPDFVQKAGLWVRLVVRAPLIVIGAIVCRNERARRAIVGLGISGKKVAILSGFYGIQTDGVRAIPSHVEDFLRGHSPVLAAMASSGPEYGISLLMEARVPLRLRYPHLGVLLIGPGGIEGQAVSEDLLVTGELPHEVALGVLQKVDVFVRSTYFDGDASSVREALALGVPVVASDTDFRPDGVILFQRGDVKDLSEKIAHALGSGHRRDARLQRGGSGSLERLLAIYGEVGRPSRLRGSPA